MTYKKTINTLYTNFMFPNNDCYLLYTGFSLKDDEKRLFVVSQFNSLIRIKSMDIYVYLYRRLQSNVCMYVCRYVKCMYV